MKYVQNKKINQRIMNEEVMLFLPREDEVTTSNDEVLFFLEKTSFDIWMILEEEKDIKQITKELTQMYSVDEDVAKKDVCAFIEEGVRIGIIEEIQ